MPRFAHRIVALLLLLGAVLPHGAKGDPLPAPLKAWISLEQEHMSRAVDTTRLLPLTNEQDPAYAPEGKAVFSIKSYWVDAARMNTFEGMGLTEDLRSLFLRAGADGRAQVRLLVHPESESLYEELTRTAEAGETFKATATASSRTLLVWPADAPARAFFGKLSLDKDIGEVRRTISQGEVVRSVGVNDTLYLARERGELPASFAFIPEVLGTIARDMEEGGMVIRAIPEEVKRGDVRYVPLFALYAPAPEGKRPLLRDMLASSGEDVRTFVRERILVPFARQWFDVAMESGIFPEPHGQNVLLEVGRDGLPTGRFVHRDFGGFNLDFPYREKLGLALPDPIPRITTIERDYKAYQEAPDMVARNLDTFFYGGFVHNLDREVPRWQLEGLIGGPPLKPDTFKRDLLRALERECKVRTGVTKHLGEDLKGVRDMVSPVRAKWRRTFHRVVQHRLPRVRRVSRPPVPGPVRTGPVRTDFPRPRADRPPR